MTSLPPFLSSLLGSGGTPGAVSSVGADPSVYGLSPSAAALEVPTIGGIFGLAGQPRRIKTGPGGENPYVAPGSGALAPTKTTLGQLIQDFYQLDRAQQIAIEQKLWDAGYYTDVRTGQPMKSAPTFGSYSPETTLALENAAREAAGTGRDLNTVINDATASGAGQAQRQIYRPGVVGHGYRNVIDLRNPHDVGYATDRMAQQLLGRIATQQEKDAVTQTIQSQDFADGMAKYNAQEQMTQQDFQARVADRNAQMYYYTGQVPPDAGGASGAAGGTPGDIQSPGQFATSLLASLGVPVTESNAAAIIAWAKAEGGNWNNSAKFNPLNTTQRMPGSSAMNSVGVQSYSSWAEGLAATVKTLNNGRYGDILNALKTGDASNQLGSAAQGLRTWSGGGYSTIQSLIPGAKADAAQAVQQAGSSGGSMASGLQNPQSLLGANGTANASNAPVTTPQTSSGTGLGVSGVQSFISTAESQIGVPYQWGGTAPGQGFDCSGLVQWAMKQHGVDPGRTTYDQFANPRGAAVQGIENAQPGDLIFFDPTGGKSPEHVGIYLGGGQMLDADHSGDTIGIRKSVSGYGNIVGIKRFPVGSNQSGSNIVGGADTYVPGSNTIMTQPGSPEAEAYNQLTQGPARIEYGAHNILNGIGVINNMIKAQR